MAAVSHRLCDKINEYANKEEMKMEMEKKESLYKNTKMKSAYDATIIKSDQY